MARISIPTTARLPSSLRVDPNNSAVTKILSRLTRSSLISVALDWLDEANISLAVPYLRDDDEDEDNEDVDDFYPAARSPRALIENYLSLQERKGSKREVLDRIVEGDWRHGLTLYQLAMADLQYLYDHPTSQKWSAYRIMPLQAPHDPDGEELPEVDRLSLTVPRFHPSTFLKTLQSHVLPDVKAHYNFDAHRSLPLLILRIFILDSPYNTNHALQSGSTTNFDSSRTVYIAFPDASPYIFISKPQSTTSTTSVSSTSATSAVSARGPTAAGESKSLNALLVEGIPKSLSRPLCRERFTLQSTDLVTRNLAELVERRGGGRTNCAGGGWSIYADEGRGGSSGERGKKRGRKETPLDLVLPSPPLSELDQDQENLDPGSAAGRKGAPAAAVLLTESERRSERATKRARLVAKARFGETGMVRDGKGVERVDIVIEDPFPKVGGQEVGGEEDEGGEEMAQRDSARSDPKGGKRKSRFDQILENAGENEDDEEDDNNTASAPTWRPHVKLTFHGSHVFAGIRQLVESGVIDGERMPGWMTGEEGVTIGAVRHGRIRGYKGSGV
ncbi:centromere protein Chl4/mis15/CENP-N [Dichotomopilus funicola]|uniref:Centromere protein Chl4/mis15/CENP-N n=1 Tax=Dichotomopilus funicola TaxID=1934379 RepID=A0AAN6V2E3_9PEZI|nr:centromere protein Chl4/mis15/CENP-N [Dichotomopilus funicola]